MEKMPKIVLPISLQMDNSIDWEWADMITFNTEWRGQSKAHLSLECKIRVAFLWQTQIQTTKYGLYDGIRIKKKVFILIL